MFYLISVDINVILSASELHLYFTSVLYFCKKDSHILLLNSAVKYKREKVNTLTTGSTVQRKKNCRIPCCLHPTMLHSDFTK